MGPTAGVLLGENSAIAAASDTRGGDEAIDLEDPPQGTAHKDLVVLGSGKLIASLRRADLIDAYTLLIPRMLRLTQATPTTTSVIVARGKRAGELQTS